MRGVRIVDRHDAMGPGRTVILGRDGIAEAVQELAAQERFRFFRLAPSSNEPGFTD